MKENEIKIFEDRKVRTLWDAELEKWFFSIVDVVAILTESPNPRKNWSVLKTRFKVEGSQLATNCSQLKIKTFPKFRTLEKLKILVITHPRFPGNNDHLITEPTEATYIAGFSVLVKSLGFPSLSSKYTSSNPAALSASNCVLASPATT